MWEFFAQGNANVLFKDVNNSKRLLRVRKANTGISVDDVLSHLNRFSPLLQYYCVPELIVLSEDEFFALQQETLSTLAEKNVLLVENVLYSALSYEKIKLSKHITIHYNSATRFVLEMKPKWLYDFPREFSNCRNCALDNFRNEPLVCPLNLLYDPKKWCCWVLGKLPDPMSGKLILEAFQKTTVFRDIYNLQKLDGIHSLLFEGVVSDELIQSMVVRDLTIFFKFTEPSLSSDFIIGNTGVEIKIIDLDWKLAKPDKWQKQELSLREGEFYQKTACRRPCS